LRPGKPDRRARLRPAWSARAARAAATLDRTVERHPGVTLAAVTALANALPGGAVFLYLEFADSASASVAHPGHAGHVQVLAFVLFLAVALPLGALMSSLGWLPVRRWLASGQPPTRFEQMTVLRQPLLRAMGGFAYWAIAAVLFGSLEAALGYPARHVALIVITALLGACASAALTALLIERLLRPITIRLLAGEVPDRRFGIGVLPRLLLSWAFGSGVPLVALLLAPMDQGNRTLRSFAGPLALLCGAGLVSGFTIITGAARSVSEPLHSVRSALRRVEQGDLGVAVPVDNAGEVGQLQVGVNQMVAGLRERRQLEDLFGRYVGAEVARQAVEQGVDLGGERTEASALFVDLIGSTALAASLPPENVVRTLNAFFAAVVAAVAEEGGWVNKFEGDGALCVFGPPGTTADHPARALRAALAIGRALDRAATEHPQLSAAIGVSSGEVVAGNIGSPERFEYTVVGDPVNEAARLSDLAKTTAGRVLASGRAVAAANNERRNWQHAGSETLRGRARPTDLYQPADQVGTGRAESTSAAQDGA
jgi:adenylate cyclase